MDTWIGLTINDEKVKEIFDRIDAAKSELIQCVNELDKLGIMVSIGKEPLAATSDSVAE